MSAGTNLPLSDPRVHEDDGSILGFKNAGLFLVAFFGGLFGAIVGLLIAWSLS